MMPLTTFDEILEAVDHLPVDEQAELVDVIHRRLADIGRRQIVNDVEDARADHSAGKTSVAAIDELMREIDQ